MENNGLRELLEQLSTEQLDEMLWAELRKKPVDGAAVRLIMQILRERDAEQPMDVDAELMAAWEKYREPVPKRKVPEWFGTLLRVASVILVLGLLLWVVPQAEAAPSLWERLVWLTESVFEFFAPDDTGDHRVRYEFKTDNPGLQQVYDAVVAMGVTDPVVPTWLPEGYALVEAKETTTPAKKQIYVTFTDSENYFTYIVELHNETVTHDYFKDDTPLDNREYGGIMHNVMRNHDKWLAIWVRGNVECFLSIGCQEDEFYNILESIYIVGDE